VRRPDDLGDLEAVLVRLIDARITARLARAIGCAVTSHSQRDGERPPGAGKAKFLRVHRLAREGGDPGATVQGRARLMTADAWQRWCGAIPSRARRPVSPAPAPHVSADDVIAAKLGIRRTA
jgi:hypothetical protein